MSMNPGFAVPRSNGSSEAWVALAALARALNISMEALQFALNGAYDILEIASGDPVFALQVSLHRMQYRIDSNILSDIIGRFRYLFGPLINHQNPGSETSALIRYYGFRDTPAEVQFWRSQNSEQLARTIAMADPSLRSRLFLGPTDVSLGSQQRQGFVQRYTQGDHSGQGSERGIQ